MVKTGAAGPAQGGLADLACLACTGFGTVSFFQEGELPQIHHLALAALCVKIACAALAVTLLTVHFLRRTASGPGVAIWRGLAILGVTALTSAAILRWFS